MEIFESNFDVNDKRIVYKLTKSSGISVQDADDGQSVPVKYWALYNDPKPKRDGSAADQTVLSIVDTDGTKYSTISATFIREFAGIADIMGDDSFAIIIRHGTTKAGKAFVTCELDCDF